MDRTLEFTYEIQCGEIQGTLVAESPEEAFMTICLKAPKEAKLGKLARWRRSHRPSTPVSRKKFPHVWYYQTPESLSIGNRS